MRKGDEVYSSFSEVGVTIFGGRLGRLGVSLYISILGIRSNIYS